MNNGKICMQADHIILPKATLKRFANPVTKKICYLDLSDSNALKIKYSFPKSFHTQKGLYYPELDNIIKKYETKIGEYRVEIEKAIEKNDVNVDLQQLKKDIIKIVNIQFKRVVVSDDKLLCEVAKQLKNHYSRESLSYILRGCYPKHFQDEKMEFEKSCKDKNAFRYFVQKIMRYDNPIINLQYKDFFPYILIIPDDIDSTFILPPQHFIPNDEVLRIIISPRISLALYPKPYNKCSQVFKYLTKEEVDSFVPRTIESALNMINEFREIIGEEEYLNDVKNKLEKYKLIICELSKNIILINGNDSMLNNCLNFNELLVSLMLFKPDYKNVIIKLSIISSVFLHEKEFIECIRSYEKHGINLAFVNDIGLENLNNNFKLFSGIEEAKKFFEFK